MKAGKGDSMTKTMREYLAWCAADPDFGYLFVFRYEGNKLCTAKSQIRRLARVGRSMKRPKWRRE